MKTVGALLGTMSGSMGGLVASHNRGGQYFRQRVVPTNPNSSGQNAVRSYMAAAVAAWSNELTDAQREAWRVYALNVPTTDSLGQELVLTGQQMFIRSAVTRARASRPFILPGPTIYDRGQPVAGIIAAVQGTNNVIGVTTGVLSNTVTFMSPVDGDGDAVLQMGRPVSPAVNFYKGPFRYTTVTSVADDDTSATLPATPVADVPFGPLTVGERRPIRLVIAYDDGRVSTEFMGIFPVVDDTL